MKHTPGPWEWNRPPISHDDEFRSLAGADGKGVFRLNDVYLGYPECGQDLVIELSNEDARLIAAAPDLLDALNDLIRWDEDPLASGNDKYFAMTAKARAAIAKAKGPR